MITKVDVEHVYSYLHPDPDDHDEIVELADWVTSWKVPGAWHSPLYQRYLELKRRGKKIVGPVWDGKRHLLTSLKLRFPTGLVPRVQKVLWSKGFDVELNDTRVYPQYKTEVCTLEGIALREYQVAGIQAGFEHHRGVFKLPPGTGKTELLIALVRSLEVYPVLWLTHLQELLDQTYRRFVERLSDSKMVGKVGEGEWKPSVITVATIQTLSRRMKTKEGKQLLQNAQVVISDEAHHEPAGTWYKVLMRCPAPFRFGCSATPLDRADEANLRLIGSIGPLIYELSPKEAVEANVLSLPHIFFVEYERGSSGDESRQFGAGVSAKGPRSLEHWTWIYRDYIVENKIRNEFILDITQRAVEEGRRVLILIRMLRHGRILEEALQDWFDTDTHVKFLRGESFTEQRREVVEQFRKGLVKVIIASAIFDEGVDIPEVDTVIIAAGGKSGIKAVQRVGRGMRLSDSAHELHVYDFMDRSNTILRKHSRARKKAYRSMELGKVETIEWKFK